MYTTRRLQQLLLNAEKKAEKMKDEYVSVEHLYLALLDERTHRPQKFSNDTASRKINSWRH